MKGHQTTTARVSRRRVGRVLAALATVGLVGAVPAVSASAASVHQARMVLSVSAQMPLDGPSVSLSALRPTWSVAPPHAAVTPPGQAANTWSTVATMPGAVVHDVAFPTAQIGYAAAELGQVWKTTDGGKTWTEILNRGFPYYFYGVDALSSTKLVISGFNDTTSQGIIAWSDDGGATWSADEVLSDNAWVARIRLPAGAGHGLAMNGGGASGSAPNAAWYTTKPDQWTQVTPDPDGGWFGNQFTLLGDHSAYASGITFCKSVTTGATWTCGPSVDKVFDGPTSFVNDSVGWVGGGEISPKVAGWLHRTTDGGAHWSGRVLQTPWPVRQIEFLNPLVGWAAGGNIFSNAGGIYYTSDGGKTWVQDIDTGDEVGACAHHLVDKGAKTRVWCVGDEYNGSSFIGNVYRTTVITPAGAAAQ